MNSDLSDIATNGLTNAVTKDGQTTITAPFKGASGSVGLPMYAFSADPDTGMYRIGANNIGISANGAKVLDIGIGGMSATYLIQPDGTVLLPSYTFGADLDSGIYRIGANNIGVTVNATKILDISTTGLNVVGTISANGQSFSPLAQGAGMVNGTIVESHTGNAATFAIKTLAGADPSASDPVFVVFRNVTAGTGNYTTLTLTAALSLVVSPGSTLGFVSATAARIWLAIFNDAGTARLAVINCRSGVNVFPLSAWEIASSTAEGGAGAADSAQIFYTGTAVTAKAYSVIGYASYETGLTTAGTWDASPTRIQLYGVGTKLPGDTLQTVVTSSGAFSSGTTQTPADNTIPQITEGDEYITRAITPSSAANLLTQDIAIQGSGGGAQQFTCAMFQDATANALIATTYGVSSANDMLSFTLRNQMLAATTSSTTFRVRVGPGGGVTFYYNGRSGAQILGGVLNSFFRVTEIMA